MIPAFAAPMHCPIVPRYGSVRADVTIDLHALSDAGSAAFDTWNVPFKSMSTTVRTVRRQILGEADEIPRGAR